MMTKTKVKRSILDAVHETARGLHSPGLIDKRRMDHYDTLCLTPVSGPEKNRALGGSP